ARVRAALRAAAERPDVPFVATALRADAERLAALRRPAAECACRDNAAGDAAACGSRFHGGSGGGGRLGGPPPRAGAGPGCLAAFLRVSADVLPALGGGRSTPALRAFDSPMAMACLLDRAPCLPSRMWSISSRTNSPACVEGDLPSFLSCAARSMVFLSGMIS